MKIKDNVMKSILILVFFPLQKFASILTTLIIHDLKRFIFYFNEQKIKFQIFSFGNIGAKAVTHLFKENTIGQIPIKDKWIYKRNFQFAITVPILDFLYTICSPKNFSYFFLFIGSLDYGSPEKLLITYNCQLLQNIGQQNSLEDFVRACII